MRTLLLHTIYQTQGPEAAFKYFGPIVHGLTDPGLKMSSPAPPENSKNFFDNEFLIGSTYNPDWRKIVKNKISVGVLAGERSCDAFYARATVEQADVLGCMRTVVPGHHIGFKVEAELFAPKLIEFIELLEKKRSAEL